MQRRAQGRGDQRDPLQSQAGPADSGGLQDLLHDWRELSAALLALLSHVTVLQYPLPLTTTDAIDSMAIPTESLFSSSGVFLEEQWLYCDWDGTRTKTSNLIQRGSIGTSVVVVGGHVTVWATSLTDNSRPTPHLITVDPLPHPL